MKPKPKLLPLSPEFIESVELLIQDAEIIPCTRCDGTGKRLAHPDEACHVCAGAGELVPQAMWPQWVRNVRKNLATLRS